MMGKRKEKNEGRGSEGIERWHESQTDGVEVSEWARTFDLILHFNAMWLLWLSNYGRLHFFM